MAEALKCCNCEKFFFGEYGLKKFMERQKSADDVFVVEYDEREYELGDFVFLGCPNCKTDSYLMYLGDGVLLDTFPDDDKDYCKTFVVEKSVFLKILDWLASGEQNSEIDVENFFENYVWEETEIIYEKAKEENEILFETADKDGEIFENMLDAWIKDGSINGDLGDTE